MTPKDLYSLDIFENNLDIYKQLGCKDNDLNLQNHNFCQLSIIEWIFNYSSYIHSLFKKQYYSHYFDYNSYHNLRSFIFKYKLYLL